MLILLKNRIYFEFDFKLKEFDEKIFPPWLMKLLSHWCKKHQKGS